MNTRRTNVALTAFALTGLAALTLTASRPALAQTPGFTIDNTTGLPLGNPPFTLGFEFTANQNIDVTALGLFDDSQDGLFESHDLGLYDSSGNLLVTGTADAGTVDPLTNQFRYVTVAPTSLTAGNTYFVGAVFTDGNDPLIFPGTATNFATDPAITFDQATYAVGSTLQWPNQSGAGDPAYFGPNFQFTPSVITTTPEPASYVAFAMGGFGLLGLTLKARKRQSLK